MEIIPQIYIFILVEVQDKKVEIKCKGEIMENMYCYSVFGKKQNDMYEIRMKKYFPVC